MTYAAVLLAVLSAFGFGVIGGRQPGGRYAELTDAERHNADLGLTVLALLCAGGALGLFLADLLA